MTKSKVNPVKLAPREQLKFLFSDTVVYGLGSVLNSFVSILTVPIIVRSMSIADFGVVDTVRVISAVIAAFLLFGLQQACGRFMVEDHSKEDKRKIVGTSFFLAFAISCVGAIIVFCSASIIMAKFLGENNIAAVFGLQMVALSFPLLTTFSFYQMLLKWNFSRSRFVVLSFSNALVLLMSVWLFVVVLELGIPGVFIAQLFASMFVFVLGAFFCKQYMEFGRSKIGLKALFNYGAPLMGAQCLSTIYPLLERFILVRFLGLESVGLVSLAHTYSRLVTLPSSAFQISWPPFALSVYRDKGAESLFNKVFKFYVLLTMSVFVLAMLVAKPVLTMVASDRYIESVGLAIPLAFGYLIGSLKEITGIGIYLSNKTYLELIGLGASIIVAVAATVWLVPLFGAVGAAYGFLLSRFFYTAMVTCFAYYVYTMRFNFVSGLIICSLAYSIVLIAYYSV
jgi:O-antigen/teichoic acid export membrane protein